MVWIEKPDVPTRRSLLDFDGVHAMYIDRYEDYAYGIANLQERIDGLIRELGIQINKKEQLLSSYYDVKAGLERGNFTPPDGYDIYGQLIVEETVHAKE